ncbi:MAG: efflux RND transporter permease subunit [Gammaproteobacteria bacterium]
MVKDPTTRHHTDLLGIFANHRVAANLLMLLLLLAGAVALTKLNTQFFPNFELEYIQIRTVWSGGSPEDVETAITVPLEQELKSVNGVKQMTSTSGTGVSVISLEYEEGTDMGSALDQVEERVGAVRNLPADAEQPQVVRLFRREPVARILVVGSTDLAELRPLVRRFERELLDRGIANIDLSGLPEEEIAVQVPMARMRELGLSLESIGQQVAASSQDSPAGLVGRDDVARQLRTLQQKRSELDFQGVLIKAGTDGKRIELADVADIERRPRDNQVSITYHGRPAVELYAQRDESADSLVSARIIEEWKNEVLPTLPPGVDVVVYDESWTLIRDRINLLLKNGLGGLVLVIAILFLFLNGRVAFWVAVGIPISFMATLAILYVVGGSINMISLFGMIMALGIIVDDAIVVGEDALTHYHTGEDPLIAAEGGARRMLAPVFSSSLTTISAFLPLLAVGGIIGNILYDIPLVIICVIIASLVECFLVLPGHLQHSFRRSVNKPPHRLREAFERRFNHFRDHRFRSLVTAAVNNRAITLTAVVAALILAIGLVAGKRIGFTFFPSIEGNILYANVSFVAGTPPERSEAFMAHLEKTLEETEQALGGNLVVAAVARHGLGVFADGRSTQTGPQFGSLVIELLSSDQRDVRNEELIEAWEERVKELPGIERFTVSARKGGPPGRDLEVRMFNAPPEALKQASLALQESLRGVEGVSAVEDDMPYGPQQLIFKLTPQAEALGLTTNAVARQLRAAFDGYLAQIFTDGEEELEVRIRLPDAERDRLVILEDFNIILPGGDAVPLGSVVEMDGQQGFDVLRHTGGARTVNVYADVDRRQNSADKIREELGRDLLPRLAQQYHLEYSYEGRAADQRETMADMRTGGIAALVLIYLILAWVFASYGWPLVVMTAIPFGIVGAIFGHWLLDIDLTILSMFGFFGLSGIVVNDSIILVVFFKHLREAGVPTQEAIIEAACQRFRAVLLTSLTTIAGLLPLLFETSLQAQFLIPMAVTISFGLGFATVLVLLVIPALLSLHEQLLGRKEEPDWRTPAEMVDESAESGV